MSLDRYREKRSFASSPEPQGKVEASQEGNLYVIQKHAASQLHYDLRLELDGVLKSWALPKGPSLNPAQKRLAVHMEDHPVEYGSFEGIIPEGEYGGGTVMLWDRGWWEPLGDPHEGYARGDLKFRLHGEKLRGSWVLARMKGKTGEKEGKNWLLIKKRDDAAVSGPEPGPVETMNLSVSTGRTMRQIESQTGHRREDKAPSPGSSVTCAGRSSGCLLGAEGELIGYVGRKKIRTLDVPARRHQYVVILGYIDYGADIEPGVGVTPGLGWGLMENFHPKG